MSIYHQHMGADSAHAQVRPEQHMLISVFFKLWSIVFEWTNSLKNYVKMPILVSIL